MNQEKRPNIIVFMTDHQRGDTILADSPVKTPNLDRFRSQAVTFSNAWCHPPTAAPAAPPFSPDCILPSTGCGTMWT